MTSSRACDSLVPALNGWRIIDVIIVSFFVCFVVTNVFVDTSVVYGWTTTTMSTTTMSTIRHIFPPPPPQQQQQRMTFITTTPKRTTRMETTRLFHNVVESGSSRRDVFRQFSTIISSSAILSYPGISSAASSSASTAMTELQQRLPLGHARVKYLLDHWDDITSVCGTSVMSDIERKQVIRTEGGGGNGQDACSKTPLRVQEFMGYKSTNDPLYKIDKLLIRVGSSSSNFMNNNDYNDFIDTVEEYRATADATALLAYTSSWGEANPYVLTFAML